MESQNINTMVAVKASQESLNHLLGNAPFVVIKGQLLYRQNGEVLMTTIDRNAHYTVEDYQKLPESAPFQLIHGKLEYMPSPFDIHQRIALRLTLLLGAYIELNGLGALRFAPLDVHFDKDNVYQPDLLFISNERMHILQDFVYGAPDLIIEILSRSTADKDKNEKLETYGKFGVKEYWMIDPKEETVIVYLQKEHSLAFEGEYGKQDKLMGSVLKGFEMEVAKVFK